MWKNEEIYMGKGIKQRLNKDKSNLYVVKEKLHHNTNKIKALQMDEESLLNMEKDKRLKID